jgi:hypothetical protein
MIAREPHERLSLRRRPMEGEHSHDPPVDAHPFPLEAVTADTLVNPSPGAIFSHCTSVSSDCFLAIGRDSFRLILQRKGSQNANASFKGL